MLRLSWMLAGWLLAGPSQDASVKSTSATTDGLQLEWSAPPTCPGTAAIEAAIARRLGTSSASRASVLARGKVERGSDGYVLELELLIEDAPASRRIEAESCQALADAAALVIALAIDPTVSSRTTPGTATTEPRTTDPIDSDSPADPADATPLVPESPATTESAGPRPRSGPRPTSPRPNVESDDDPRDESEPSSARRTTAAVDLHVDVGAAAGPGLFLLPEPVAFVELALGLSGRHWRFELAGNVWTPARERSSANPRIGGRFSVWAVATRGCYVPALGPVDFELCPGFEAGAAHGEGTGPLEPARRTASPWVAALTATGIRWRPLALAGRLGFSLRVEGVASLTRPSFGTDASGVIYRIPRGALRLALGVSVGLR